MTTGLSIRLIYRAALLLALVAVPQPSSATAVFPVEPPASQTTPADYQAPTVAGHRGGMARPAVRDGWTLEPTRWTLALAALGLAGLLLLANSRAACMILGHRRARRRVRFNAEEQRWASTCKRCKVRLVRDPWGEWSTGVATAGVAGLLVPVAASSAHPTVAPRAPLSRPDEPVRRTAATHFPAANGQARRTEERVPQADRAHLIVRQLLDDVLGGHVASPGARGALFFVVDELRASSATDEQTRRAEKISIGIQQLQCALQRGDEDEAELARRQLNTLAGEWISNPGYA